MSNSNLFYQESKIINPVGLTASYIIILLLSLLLGYAYTVIIIFIPVVYINFIITIGLGLLLGIINRFLIRFSHNRNKKSQLLQALISGVLINYFQWTAYIMYAFNGANIPSFTEFLVNLHWITMPQNFFPSIIEINSIGMWSVFGVVFNGFGLTIIWILEALVIIVLPIVAVYRTKVYPYSELGKKWYPKYTLLIDFESVSSSKRFLKELNTDVLQAVQNLGKGTGIRFSKIHIFYHKKEENQYLTVEKFFIESKGKGNTKSNIVINNFKINKNTAEKLLEIYNHKRERIEVL